MEIKNNYTLDEIAQVNYESKRTFKIMFFTIMPISLILTILSIIMITKSDDYYWSIVCGSAVFLLVFFPIMFINIRPERFKKRLIKINPSLKDGIEYSYLFEDEELTINEKTSNSESSMKLKYSEFKKISISKNYLLLFINQFQVYPIKKEDFNEKADKISNYFNRRIG